MDARKATSIGEKVFLVVLSAGVIWRLVPEIPTAPLLLVFLVSELLAVALILMQRQGHAAIGTYPVFVAFIGTAFPLLVRPIGDHPFGPVGPSLLFLYGGLLSLAAKVFLGRSFGLIAANRGVKGRGVYRYMRHPMYAGYILNEIGFLLLYLSVWNVVVLAIAWTAQWLRIREEERFLLRDEHYRAYAAEVRYRLIPGIV